MFKRTSRWSASTLVVCSTLCGAVACQDPVQPAPPPAASVAPPQLQTDTTDIAVRQRYAIQFDARGTIRLHQPIQLVASITASGAVQSAELAIALPELAVANHQIVSGESRSRDFPTVIPAVRGARPFAHGGTAVMATSVVIDTPGLYRAVATVQTLAREPATAGREPVQESARAELWLLVDSAHGTVLPHADARSVPQGWATVPGPRRLRSAPIGGATPALVPCTDPDCSGGGGGGSGEPGGLYNLTARWYSSDDYSYHPITQAAYTATADGTTYSGVTDSYGALHVPCAYGSYAITIDYRTPDKTQIQRASTTIHALTYQTAANACATTPSETYDTFDYNAAKVFDDMRTAVDSSRSFFQFPRSSVTVNLFDSSPTNEVSFYDDASDKITIKAGGIAGPWGTFTAAHEYGHALAAQTMGGSRGGSCPSSGHYIDGYYNLQCALSEGFADYHSVAARGPADGYVYYDIRSNAYYHGGDGSIDEGAVAAFLLDVSARATESDYINGTDYSLHYSGRYVGEQMAGCYGYQFGFSMLATGVDVLTFCMERQVDPAVTSNYFLTRSPRVTGYSTYASTPSTWNQSAIRRLWLNKLYGQ